MPANAAETQDTGKFCNKSSGMLGGTLAEQTMWRSPPLELQVQLRREERGNALLGLGSKLDTSKSLHMGKTVWEGFQLVLGENFL